MTGIPSTSVVWINLAWRTDRAEMMRPMLRELKSSPEGRASISSVSRFDAVHWSCPKDSTGEDCALADNQTLLHAPNGVSLGGRLLHGEELKQTLLRRELPISKQRDEATRKGMMGCWCSWWCVLSAYAERCAAYGAEESQMLVLEDDLKHYGATFALGGCGDDMEPIAGMEKSVGAQLRRCSRPVPITVRGKAWRVKIVLVNFTADFEATRGPCIACPAHSMHARRARPRA